MTTKRIIGIAAAAALGVTALAGGALALASQGDPRAEVGTVTMDRVNIQPGSDPVNSRDQQVAALDSIQGTFERRGDDQADFYLGGVELELGPDAWVLTAGPGEDYDGDGTPEDLLAELGGLVGQPVKALVRLDNDGDDADVYVLNDLAYRDSAGGPPPWLQTRSADGAAATPEVVAEAAAAAVGDGARVDELDRETVGDVAWEAEVNAVDGREHTVWLDAAGKVLNVDSDD